MPHTYVYYFFFERADAVTRNRLVREAENRTGSLIERRGPTAADDDERLLRTVCFMPSGRSTDKRAN